MTRRGTRNHRWMILASGAFLTIVLAIWQNAFTAVLARREAKLQVSVETLRRELDAKRSRVLQASARSAARAITAADLGFVKPTQDQVVLLDLRDAKPQVAELQVAQASVGDRVMDALLPSAGARVRSGSK